MKHLTAALASQVVFRGGSNSLTSSLSSTARCLTSTLPYPRAAVAVTVQSKKTIGGRGAEGGTPHYLLVQRANPPDQGKWSLPGGKIHVGEPTLEAAQRELQEETGLSHCQWYPFPFLTTDAISYYGTNTSLLSTTTTRTTTIRAAAGEEQKDVQFHYLIAQCFALASDGLPQTTPSDDALDAQWFTLSQMKDMRTENILSDFVVQVVERAETLSLKGLLI
jgi:ADP-ribose pyrophosphatase YjhB (NUDIX family)